MTARRSGPPPKPTELKALQGNPGKRKLSDAPIATKPSRLPPVPAGLDAHGRAAWQLYWTDGFAWLAKVDMPLIFRLCKLHDLAAAVEAAIRDDGMTTTNKETGRQALHHLVNNLLGIYGRMDDMGSLLGFDPANRSRIKVERAPVDALGEWEQSA